MFVSGWILFLVGVYLLVKFLDYLFNGAYIEVAIIVVLMVVALILAALYQIFV